MWLFTQVTQAFAQTPASAPTEADALQLLARHASATRGDTALSDLTCTRTEERNGTRAAIRMFVRWQPFALRKELTADNGARTITITDGVMAWDDGDRPLRGEAALACLEEAFLDGLRDLESPRIAGLPDTHDPVRQPDYPGLPADLPKNLRTLLLALDSPTGGGSSSRSSAVRGRGA